MPVAATVSPELVSARDRAILTAVAAGRCAIVGADLRVDGRGCCDQFAAARMRSAGWIRRVESSGRAELTPEGHGVLGGPSDT